MRSWASVFAALLFATTARAEAPRPPDVSPELREAREAQKRAEQGGPEAAKHHAAAAELLLGVWLRQGDLACSDRWPTCPAFVAILDEAAEAFDGAGQWSKSLRIRLQVASHAQALGLTELAVRATHHAGASYRRMGMYDRAAEQLARGAKLAPKSALAKDDLRQAFELWLVIDASRKASEALEEHRKLYGRSDPTATAEMLHDYLDGAAARGRFSDVVERLTPALKVHQKAPLGWQLRARSLLARAHRHRNEHDAARDLDRDVIRRHGRAAAPQLERRDSDAVAESLMREAERARSDAPIRSPSSVRPAPRASIAARERALTAADTIAAAIASLSPPPSAALQTKALHDGAMRWAALAAASHGASSRSEKEAIDGFARCLERARALRYHDANVRACEVEFARLDPSRPAFDALWLDPSSAFLAPIAHPLLDITGTPYHPPRRATTGR